MERAGVGTKMHGEGACNGGGYEQAQPPLAAVAAPGSRPGDLFRVPSTTPTSACSAARRVSGRAYTQRVRASLRP